MLMNRKNLKELLVEWRKNFVNEKKLSTFGVYFKVLTKAQKFFDYVHDFYSKIGESLKNKVLIQKQHG